MKERNLQAIVATVVSNSSIIDAMKHLSTSEQLGFAACLLGCDLKKDELPQIPDTEVAKNVTIISINPVKDSIELSYATYYERKYTNGAWVNIQLESEKIERKVVDYQNYLELAKTGILKL